MNRDVFKRDNSKSQFIISIGFFWFTLFIWPVAARTELDKERAVRSWGEDKLPERANTEPVRSDADDDVWRKGPFLAALSRLLEALEERISVSVQGQKIFWPAPAAKREKKEKTNRPAAWTRAAGSEGASRVLRVPVEGVTVYPALAARSRQNRKQTESGLAWPGRLDNGPASLARSGWKWKYRLKMLTKGSFDTKVDT